MLVPEPATKLHIRALTVHMDEENFNIINNSVHSGAITETLQPSELESVGFVRGVSVGTKKVRGGGTDMTGDPWVEGSRYNP